jgi:multicomponent Na+:H+ antiporter subunit D
MIEPIHPAFIFIIGMLLFPLLKNGRLKQIYLLALPVIAFIDLYFISYGTHWTYHFMDYTLTLGRVDILSKVFGYVFTIIAFCAMLYALHVKEDGHHIAAYMYVGSALGVVLAGDLITLYLFWEIMAVTSVVLIFYRRTKSAVGAGMRYIMVHATGGILLLGGIIMYMNATGSYTFDHFDYSMPGTMLILLGFIINAAVPPFHAWLSDAYPEATITGAVFLTAFTTKSAVYVLIRGFSGFEILMWLGAIMAVYGVIWAILQNDIRRLLSYHIISQVGYMVAGVGMGTFLAINGSAAHAFCHILYKALLFMGAGAVIYATGKSKFTELGGLYKAMPSTLILFMIGAFSISGVPLFNGFVSKTMVIAASGEIHNPIVYAMLVGAGVGTFLCIALKIPYFVFFGKDVGLKTKKLPLNMLAAMGIAAFLCIFIGIYPQILYNILPYSVEYVPYTAAHVIGEVQLLLFAAMAFFMLRSVFVPKDTIVLDTDLFYRIPGKWFIWFINNPLAATSNQIAAFFTAMKDYLLWFTRNPQRAAALIIDLLYPRKITQEELTSGVEEERQKFGRTIHRSPIGDSITMVLIFLFVYMVYYLFRGSVLLQEIFLPVLAWMLFAGLLLIATLVVVMLLVIPVITFAMRRTITNR